MVRSRSLTSHHQKRSHQKNSSGLPLRIQPVKILRNSLPQDLQKLALMLHPPHKFEQISHLSALRKLDLGFQVGKMVPGQVFLMVTMLLDTKEDPRGTIQDIRVAMVDFIEIYQRSSHPSIPNMKERLTPTTLSMASTDIMEGMAKVGNQNLGGITDAMTKTKRKNSSPGKGNTGWTQRGNGSIAEG